MTSALETSPAQTRSDRVEPLIIGNDQTDFITPGAQPGPARFDSKAYLSQAPLTVIDAASLELIQVLLLHQAIDHTQSATGSAVVFRSLIQPSTDLAHIQAKQASLREIDANDRLRQALADYLHEFSNGESALYKFFNKGLYALFPYPDLKKARRAAANITRMLPTIPEAESLYLNSLISGLKRYRGSPVDQMMGGAVYKSLGGLKSDQEVGVFTPKLKFTPRRLTRWLIVGPAVMAAPYLRDMIGWGPALSPLLPTVGMVLTGACAFYAMAVKPVRDTGNFIEPLRARSVHDQCFGRAVDTIGMIDELLSCHAYAENCRHPTTLPNVSDGAHHFFEATGLKNPVLAEADRDFISNHVCLNGARLTFITGPNSGGKTTICKSIIHNQLMAQTGGYMLAEKAAVNIADMISYQAPKFDGLQDSEGRFGTELSRTRDIFYATGPKSLVILDELAEGTTYEEQLHHSFEILSDFYAIGNNTVLVTHNHSLVDDLRAAQKGQCLMVEFDGDDPTYRVAPGISRVSHAERVARKINFSREDRRRYMQAKGYL